jgi:hypothetical protein
MPRTIKKGSAVRRQLVALTFFLVSVVAAGSARAQDVINLGVRYGLGLSVYNRLADSALAPSYAHIDASYLFLEVGPLRMGPGLAYRLGFGTRDVRQRDQETGVNETVEALDVQHSLMPAWVVYGRPNVHFSWSAYGGFSFVLSQPDVSGTVDDESGDTYFVWGLEVGGTASYFITAGFAVTLGAQYDFFYGIDPVHVISFDLGLLFSFEVMR